MKSTGVIRRIDELGRIVIPKEIRKTLRIHDGDNLEIYTDSNENIILSKYSSISKISEYAINFANAIYKFLKHDVIITDTNKIIAVEGTIRKNYSNQCISNELLKYLQNREFIIFNEKNNLRVIPSDTLNGYCILSPIIVESETVGLIIVYSENEKLTDLDVKIIQFVTSFFTKYLED